MIACLKCRRWKLFNEKPCADHPGFQTEQEIADAAIFKKAGDAMKVLSYVAGLRTMAAMGRTDLLDNISHNLQRESEDIQSRVYQEVEQRGLMMANELTDSLFMAMELRGRQ